jgi:transcriptional regulator with XRE-family HTH domain
MITTPLLRTQIGGTLRANRISQGRTLRDVAKSARVSLGYLSEVERGQKEASSELLNSICQALELQLSSVLSDVTLQLKALETPTLVVVEDAA